MRRILPIVTASAAVLAAACSSGGPVYYVGADGGTVALIRWSAQENGRVRGTITDDTLSGTAPSETVSVQNVPVTLKFNGSDVSFNGPGIYTLAGANITARLSGGTLHITAPEASGYLESAVLRAASQAVYDSDLARLRLRVRHDNVAAEKVQARQQAAAQVTSDQQQVSADISGLESDTDTLASDVTQMGTDVQQVSTDLQQLMSDAANGQGASCDNVTTVDDDATTVDNDGTTVGNDETTVTVDISTLQGDISQLTSDVATLQKDHGAVVAEPSPQTVISQAQTDMASAVSKANTYVATVNGYLQQAYTTANNLAGTNCGGSV
jgi:hypothetical protein